MSSATGVASRLSTKSAAMWPQYGRAWPTSRAYGGVDGNRNDRVGWIQRNAAAEHRRAIQPGAEFVGDSDDVGGTNLAGRPRGGVDRRPNGGSGRNGRHEFRRDRWPLQSHGQHLVPRAICQQAIGQGHWVNTHTDVRGNRQGQARQRPIGQQPIGARIDKDSAVPRPDVS